MDFNAKGPTDYNDILLTSIGPYWLQWGPLDFNGALWTSMGPYALQ